MLRNVFLRLEWNKNKGNFQGNILQANFNTFHIYEILRSFPPQLKIQTIQWNQVGVLIEPEIWGYGKLGCLAFQAELCKNAVLWILMRNVFPNMDEPAELAVPVWMGWQQRCPLGWGSQGLISDWQQETQSIGGRYGMNHHSLIYSKNWHLSSRVIK